MISIEEAPEVQSSMNKFIDNLSPSLHAQVQNYLHFNVINSVPQFTDASDVEINFIVHNLKSVLALPKEDVIVQGSMGKDMYFIINGKVEVLLIKTVIP
jgi:CRP-like cAMP-binding protein